MTWGIFKPDCLNKTGITNESVLNWTRNVKTILKSQVYCYYTDLYFDTPVQTIKNNYKKKKKKALLGFI